MIFGLASQVFENRVLPEPLHVIPVFNLTVSNGIVDRVGRAVGGGEGLVANVKVEVFGTLTTDVAAGRSFGGGNHCREDERGGIVTGKTEFCVTGTAVVSICLVVGGLG